jgi:hypothetical protein
MTDIQTQSVEGKSGDAPKICPTYASHCKRGHLKTEASTFPRKVWRRGRLYIVRECRQCHSMRNTPEPKIRGPQKRRSRWVST